MSLFDRGIVLCLQASLIKAILSLVLFFPPHFLFLLLLFHLLHPSCSYYGLTVWFPDMIKYLQKQEYSSRTRVFVKEKVQHVTFNFTLENQVHRQGEYFNDK